MRVADLGDRALAALLAAGVLRGDEADEGHELGGAPEAVEVADLAFSSVVKSSRRRRYRSSTPWEEADRIVEAAGARYSAQTGHQPWKFVFRAVDGARRISARKLA